MDNRNDLISIPKEKFTFVQMDARIHDKKIETRAISYMEDAWIRFKRNKASVLAAIIIIVLVLFAIITPFISSYAINQADGNYAKRRPRIAALAGTGFWDGSYAKKLNDRFYIYMMGIAMSYQDYDGLQERTWEKALSSPYQPIQHIGEAYTAQGNTYRDAQVDSYKEAGFKYLNVTFDRYNEILEWEKANNLQIIFPMVDVNNAEIPDDANYWYKHAANGTPLDANGKKMSLETVMEKGLVENYVRTADGSIKYFIPKDKSMVQVRVLYSNYYYMLNGHEASFVMGSDAQGYDIMTRLAYGVQLSLMLSLFVSAFNLLFGTIYGAVEGYYGGWVDMLGERISDVLNGIPFIVVCTLFQLHLVIPGKVSPFVGLLFAFFLTGWIGMAYRVRTQFYRFKNQEYVLAARTLGARDRRIMFKHIFPNALGTIITQAVLIIPSTILSETILSYLGIVNFNGQNITSLGTMLANGQGYLGTDPHIILFPALVISLLMISFNLFGNGLRDAFNPSLRGADE